MVVDALAARWGTSWAVEKRFLALTARTEVAGRRYLLAKPQTFMNASGESVARLLQFYQIPVAGLLVVVDDADLALGAIRMRAGGRPGGHHGLESVTAHLGGESLFARQRIGIGRDRPELREIVGHVLGRFGKEEWQWMQKVIVRAGDQIQCWIESGIEKAMNQYNGAIERPADKKDRL
jgi:PTH1 family peptidyl-tRNA hydrolase